MNSKGILLINDSLIKFSNSFICSSDKVGLTILDFSLTDNIIDYFRRRKIEVFSYGLLTNKLNIKEYVNYIIDNKN